MIDPARAERTHGFPLEFRVETSLTEDFSEASTVFETSEPFPDPERHPFWIELETQEARFVRIVATELSANFLGFAELMVFRGNRNLALRRRVIALDVITVNNFWRKPYLTDGFTPLGANISERTRRRNGFRTAALPSAETEAWFELDWVAPQDLSAIALHPAYPIPNLTSISRWGKGFPSGVKIEVAGAEDPPQWRVAFETPGNRPAIENPGNIPWYQILDAKSATRLRVISKRLPFDSQREEYAMAFSEIEVFDTKGNNIAVSARVASSHSFGSGDGREVIRWDPVALTDNIAAEGELIPARDWLMRLDQRRQLLQEQKQIEENLLVAEARAAGTRRLYLLVGAASLVGLLLLVSFLVLRSRRAAAGELRERIANDLHDEIGSTLGSIALNADVLSRAVESPDTGSRLATMAGRAREASQTMRDLVWVVDSRTDDSVNLLERLRSTAAELLGDISHRFEVPEPFPRLRLSPEQKRHLLLFVKESLHNVLRHAEASEVVIAIKKVNHDWQFAVSDDGTGFDFDQSDHEQLDRLRSRATRLGGELRVDSTRGSGTTVSIRVPTSAKAIRSAV